MLNRLFKIICRDNQYGGFLRVRGEYEVTESSDEGERASQGAGRGQEDGRSPEEADRERMRRRLMLINARK